MEKKRRFYVFLTGVLGLWPVASLAFERVNILRQSASGETIILDKGALEGVRSRDYALIYRREESEFNNPQYSFIAKIEALKVGDRHSIWMLLENQEGQIIDSAHLVMKRISQDPRAPLNMKRTQVIVPQKSKIKEYKQSLDGGRPTGLVKINDKYINEKTFQLPKKHDDEQDIEVRSYGRWAEFGSNLLEKDRMRIIYLGPKSLEPSLDERDLRRNIRRKIFEDTLKESTHKTNDLDYGLSYFYEDSLEEISKTTALKKKYPYYEYLKDLKIKAKEIDRRSLERLAQREFTWSKNYNDAQLRKNFLNWGVANEIYRQRNVLQKKKGHEINLRYSTGLGKPYTTDSSFSLGHEFHLGATSKKLEHFTVEWEFERGISHELLGGTKSTFHETIFHGYFYWYFYNSPDSLKSYLVYIGTGLKRGNATLYETPTKYKFKVAGIPLWRLGIKYRFKPGDHRDELIPLGMGLNLLWSIGDTLYSGFESKEIFAYQDIKKNTQRLSVGLNFYF